MNKPRVALTDTQRRAAQLLLRGRTNKKTVAFQLNVGYRTVQRWSADARFRAYQRELAGEFRVSAGALAEVDGFFDAITKALEGKLDPRTAEYRKARRHVGAIYRGPMFGGRLIDSDEKEKRLNQLFLIDAAIAFKWDRPLPEYDAFIQKRTSHKPGPGRWPDW